MTTFQAVTPAGAYEMAMGFGHGYAKPSYEQKINDAWKLAEAFDKKADAFFAASNTRMGMACRELALNAANRAVRFSKVAA